MADNQLNVSIGAEIGGLQKGLDKAGKELSKFDAKIKKIGKIGDEFISVGKSLSKGLTAPIIAVGAAIGKVVSDTVGFSSKLSESASQAGLTAESYQELTFAISQYGISSNDAERTLGRLNQRIGLAAQGNEKYSSAFQNLGVSITDTTGKIKGSRDVFLEVAESLSNIEDPAVRSAQASEIFGVNLSRRLLPALSNGADGIEDFTKEAQKLGIVMSDEQVANAEQFGISIDNLKLQFSAITREIGSAFIPILQDSLIPAIQNNVLPAVRNMADNIKGVANTFSNLPSSIKKGLAVFTGIAAAIGPVSLAFGGLLKLIPTLITGLGGLGSAFTLLTGPIGLVVAGIAAIGVAVYKNWDSIKPYIIDTINWFIDLYNESAVVRGAVQGIVTEFKIGFAIIGNVLGTAWELIKSFALGVAESFRGVGDIIKGALTADWDAVKKGFGQIQNASSQMVANMGADLKTGFQKATEDISTAFWEGAEKVKNPEKIKHITDLAFGGLKEEVEENVSKQVSEGIQAGMSRVTVDSIPSLKMDGENAKLPLFDVNSYKVNTEELKQAIEDQQDVMTEAQVAQAISNAEWSMLQQELNYILQDGMVNGISSAFESVGRALAEGKNVIQAFGKSMMSAMGGLMQEFGKAMIGWAMAKEAIDQLFKSSNPFLVAAAGAALVALGAAVSSTSSRTQSSLSSNPPGSGSISTGSGGYEVPSSSNVANASSTGVQRYVFEIEGQKLVGVLSNTLDRNSRLASDINI